MLLSQCYASALTKCSVPAGWRSLAVRQHPRMRDRPYALCDVLIFLCTAIVFDALRVGAIALLPDSAMLLNWAKKWHPPDADATHTARASQPHDWVFLPQIFLSCATYLGRRPLIGLLTNWGNTIDLNWPYFLNRGKPNPRFWKAFQLSCNLRIVVCKTWE
jgi:hypothetical protein